MALGISFGWSVTLPERLLADGQSLLARGRGAAWTRVLANVPPHGANSSSVQVYVAKSSQETDLEQRRSGYSMRLNGSCELLGPGRGRSPCQASARAGRRTRSLWDDSGRLEKHPRSADITTSQRSCNHLPTFRVMLTAWVRPSVPSAQRRKNRETGGTMTAETGKELSQACDGRACISSQIHRCTQPIRGLGGDNRQARPKTKGGATALFTAGRTAGRAPLIGRYTPSQPQIPGQSRARWPSRALTRCRPLGEACERIPQAHADAAFTRPQPAGKGRVRGRVRNGGWLFGPHICSSHGAWVPLNGWAPWMCWWRLWPPLTPPPSLSPPRSCPCADSKIRRCASSNGVRPEDLILFELGTGATTRIPEGGW